MLVGAAVGVLLTWTILGFFTGKSFAELSSKFLSIDFQKLCVAAFAGIVALIVSVVVLVSVHEAGHLVCGLLTGYRFVSYRIFNLTLINENGRLKFKRFNIGGTLGQCLMTPPDWKNNDFPVLLYNFGGILAGIIVLIAAVPLLVVAENPIIKECLTIFILIDLWIVLTSAIPMRLGGIPNDAYNIIQLRKSDLTRRGLLIQLYVNALIQSGIRPKDLPDEWREIPSGIDYKDPQHVALPIMAGSIFMDSGDYDHALEIFEDLRAHSDEIIGIYDNEIRCELLFLLTITGKFDSARSLLNDDLRQYITTYKDVVSSKLRVLCAVALLEGNRKLAGELFAKLEKQQDGYLLKGEVRSDLWLIKSLLEFYDSYNLTE